MISGGDDAVSVRSSIGGGAVPEMNSGVDVAIPGL